MECFAPVDGEYPLQFVSGEAVRKDEKLHFVAGTRERASRDQHPPGKQYSGGQAGGWALRGLYLATGQAGPLTSMPRCLRKSMSSLTCRRPAFGLQLVYTDGISAAEVEVVRDGDAVLLPEGYHPNVAIPGCER